MVDYTVRFHLVKSFVRDDCRRKKDDNQVVLYNEDQKRIIVQAKQKEVNPKSSTTTLMTPGTIQSVCSLCKRPIEEKAVVSYMDSNYFRFLDETFRE